MRRAFLGFLLTWLGISSAARSADFVVEVPNETPAEATLYLAGSGETLGNWKPDGVKLERRADGTYAGAADVPEGKRVEFKITRGSWDTVEIAADGRDRPNRQLLIEPGTNPVIRIVVEKWGPAVRTGVVGTLKLHELKSDTLGRPRTIRVLLPSDYESHPERRYAVLYQQDGQNCFDPATSAFGHEWGIDELLAQLGSEGKIDHLIVVGIDNGGADRIGEYTFTADAAHGGGHGERYARFLIEEVLPFVEKEYHIRDDRLSRLIGGSSLGGLISLEIARRHPDLFGGVIAMSPSLWWSDAALLSDLERDAAPLQHTRLWIDMGTREGSESGATKQVELARRLDAILTKLKIDHRLTIAKDAQHNEQAWAERFPDAMLYLLPKGHD